MINFNKVSLRSSASVLVQAHWEPIVDATYSLHQPTRERFNRLKERAMKQDSPEWVDMTWEQALNLFNFRPAQPLKEYCSSDFRAFLPSSPVNVGDVWELDSEGVLPFLRQFHPGATMEFRRYSKRRKRYLRVGQKGAKACLRAISPKYADIVFRIHARFTLDASSETYFMPAQFAGNLVVDLNTGTICQFTLSLPTRNSNVDINAFGVADMVSVPRMELYYSSSLFLHESVAETMISENEACKKLERAFYEFAEINWLPIEVAVDQAKTTNRPIHAVLLWGSFDDESC